MKTINLHAVVLLLASFPLSMMAATAPTNTKLTAAEIVEKNIQARGGLSAWHGIKALEMKGKMEAGGNQRSTIPVPGQAEGSKVVPQRPKEEALLPFVMDLERGRKMRLELQFKGQTAVQVYDGAHGWKLRPYLNRRQTEPFTPDEVKIAASQPDLDGLLIDYAAKGSAIAFEGMEQIDGHDAYKLKVTDKAGVARHVWIDAQSFLETKIEGVPRRLDGKIHPTAVYLRDYRAVNGIMMPYLMETTVEGVKDTEKIVIDNIETNPKFDEAKFTAPR